MCSKKIGVSTLPLLLILIYLACLFPIVGCNSPQDFLLPQEISQHSAAIFNGTIDTGHPAVGYLRVLTLDKQHSYFCTGTLIGPKTVLTAAHCLYEQQTPWSKLTPDNFFLGGVPGTKHTVVSNLVHPSYKGQAPGDLAVLQLQKEVTGIVPSVLAAQPPNVGEQITLIGFGNSGPNISDVGQAKRKATNVIASLQTYYYTVNGASGSQGNTCGGDSGGPDFALRNNQEIQIGVHSKGNATCTLTESTMVDAYYQWIMAQVPGTDPLAPQVKIISPLQGADVGSSFSVEVDATDDTAISRVELYLNEIKKDDLTTPPFNFQLQNISAGSLTIKAIAYDAEGKTGTASVTVTVKGNVTDKTPPSIRIISPSKNAVLGPNFSVKTEATDNVGMARVELYLKTAKVATRTVTPYTFSLQNIASGILIITAKAYDIAQNTRSASVTVTVQLTSKKPFGSLCTKPEECTSGLCSLDDTALKPICTVTCDPQKSTCPQGTECLLLDQDWLCGKLSETTVTEEEDAGCNGCKLSARSRSTPWSVLVLLLVFILRIRTRRPGSRL